MSRSSRTLLIGAAALVAIALVIALTGGGEDPDDAVSTSGSTSTTSTTTTTTTTTVAATPTTASSSTTTLSPREALWNQLEMEAMAVVETMTSTEIAYQLMATGFTGTDVRQRFDVVGSPCVGAVFVTDSNGNWLPSDDPDAAASTISLVRSNAQLCPARPLIATDAELGTVVRVPLSSPAAAPEWTRRYESERWDLLDVFGEEVFDYATALRDLGIDLNFGVVGDVDVDPSHFMARSGRTFGDDHQLTGLFTDIALNAHCGAGVAPALKHFPNQGSTVEDPHEAISTSTGGIGDFWSYESSPWRGTRAPVIMTGHIVVPDVDPELPASVSPAVNDLLRINLNYDGVVITDDLSNMRGVNAFIPEPSDRAVAAIRAGADLALFVDDRDVAAAAAAVAEEIEADPAFAARATEAATRTIRLALEVEDPPDQFPICRY